MDSQVTIDVDALIRPYISNGSVDITRLASDQSIRIYYTNDSSISGHIRYEPESSTFSIGLNDDEPLTRQRFTIAHELSHYMLDKPTIIEKGSMARPTQTSYTLEERRADNLASQLLMPANLVKKYLEDNDLADKLNQPNTIITIAKHYNVSPTMVVQRLRKLKYNVPYVSFA
jgi:Zn-dependent peptidase ImmA (M78 family)